MIKKEYLNKKVRDLTVKEAFDIFIVGFIKLIGFILLIGCISFLLIKHIINTNSSNDFNFETKDPIDTYFDYDEELNKLYC